MCAYRDPGLDHILQLLAMTVVYTVSTLHVEAEMRSRLVPRFLFVVYIAQNL